MNLVRLIVFFIFASMQAQASYYMPTVEEQFLLLPSHTEAADAQFMDWMKQEQSNHNLGNGLQEIANLQNEINALDQQLNNMGQEQHDYNYSSNISLLEPAPQQFFDFQRPGYVDPVTRGNEAFCSVYDCRDTPYGMLKNYQTNPLPRQYQPAPYYNGGSI